jgi:tetratricopeptide repeat protein/NUDIX domain-containing protein
MFRGYAAFQSKKPTRTGQPRLVPEAEQAYLTAIEEAEKFGVEAPRLASSQNNLASVYYAQGRYAEAESLIRRLWPWRRRSSPLMTLSYRVFSITSLRFTASRASWPRRNLSIERLEAAVVREVEEETCLKVSPQRVGKVIDRIFHDGSGRVQFHFVIVDFLCEVLDGEPLPSSDAAAVGYFKISELDDLDLTEGTAEVIREVYRNQR